MLCIMEFVFVAVRGRRACDILEMPAELKTELTILALLARLAVSNLRAPPADYVSAVDASMWGIAYVTAPLDLLIVQALYRHTIVRSMHIKLLPRAERWMREHHVLDEARELPPYGLRLRAWPWLHLL